MLVKMDRSRWKVKDYQRELAARGAKVTGRKKELIQRLEDYERNDNFGAVPLVLGEDPLPEFPDISKFKTLTVSHREEVPKISKSHVEQYVLWRQSLDKEQNNDVSAIKNGEKMIEEVLAMSWFLEQAPTSASSEEASGPVFYLSGIVAAEMRKQDSYSLKLVLDGDTGEVLQAHCEGPAGRGPTGSCKHIVAALLMLVKFVEDGELLVQLTCTQSIQTFKKPRRAHDGSPVRAEKLGKRASEEYDPRPQKYRNMPGYKDFVYNAIINFCSNTSIDVTLRHQMPIERKANLADAELHHDYLKEPLVQT